ncbi:MAG: hypothetical protein SNJ78_06175 [Spirochaetales bacterium]
MKVLLICEKEITKERILSLTSSYDLELLWYRDLIKGMDNLEEIDPEFLIISASDFPRHWKVFFAFLVGTLPKRIPVILLIDSSFEAEDRTKAQSLGIAGVVPEALSTEEDLSTLVKILGIPSRVMPQVSLTSTEAQKEPLYPPKEWVPSPEDRIELLFLHPLTLTLIEGKVLRLEAEKIHFLPKDLEKTADLIPPLYLPPCSLRIGNALHTVQLELLENKEALVFRFLQKPEELTERFA